MLANQHTILQYLPQRPPIQMVHNLLEVTDSHAVTALSITSDNIFTENGSLSEPGIIENIAQTAAAHAGYYYISQNMPVPIGFIAAIRNLQIYDRPVVGATITTTVTITNKVLDITIVEGIVTLADRTLCSCEMRIFTKSQ
ncbi:3-hydroxyacyl-ACP dehydratase [Pseudochryseolinea flava]|uniref:3-hydroxyacyl-ACP dehydratase n=1 Tax=Pseudochryseolinea flava TaxID=2059302 RepID=A0A364Y0N3_9BACT|nr:3-hydroxyacyl-ACP dehydratase [Pseudochryseolinea flava]RAW00141.1 3-hydroxyacyl-ACP dehydratase [Pseudochryseolinea flava]